MKPTQPVTPSLWMAAGLLAIAGFLAGSLVMSIFVYQTSGEISYHRIWNIHKHYANRK